MSIKPGIALAVAESSTIFGPHLFGQHRPSTSRSRAQSMQNLMSPRLLTLLRSTTASILFWSIKFWSRPISKPYPCGGWTVRSRSRMPRNRPARRERPAPGSSSSSGREPWQNDTGPAPFTISTLPLWPEGLPTSRRSAPMRSVVTGNSSSAINFSTNWAQQGNFQDDSELLGMLKRVCTPPRRPVGSSKGREQNLRKPNGR